MLLISYLEEIVDGEPIFFSSNALPVKSTKFEAAGHAFHSAALRLSGYYADVHKSEEEGKNISTEKEKFYFQSSNSYSSKSNKKSAGEAKQQDHYALLGLGHLRYLATEDQIKKSYRETALRLHPDKQGALVLAEETEAAKQEKKDKIDSDFKAIKEAYEVLMDPVRRRIYDSTDEFDDEIPQDCDPMDFFKIFGPAFLRNGRWSVNQPAPMLGDDNTPIDEVDSFYEFWYNFKSWREFPHADEFDLEQAESRDHKRWMERQNAKLSEKARKEEYVRLRTLVDNAYKRDPRILRRKEEQKVDKQRKKEAKLQAKRLLEEEAARIANEEKLRREEEEKRAAEAASNQKKLKEKEKKLLRKERNRLRTLANPILSQKLLDIVDDDVEHICSSLDKDQLMSLCDQMEGREALEIAKLLMEKLARDKKPNTAESNSQPNGSMQLKKDAASISDSKKSETPWSKEEIELLRKAMQKYPKGTSRRWEVISEYIGSNRSVEEILKATKTVLLQKPDSTKAFDSFLERRKPAQTIASPLSTRGEIFTASPSANEESSQEETTAGTNQQHHESTGTNQMKNLRNNGHATESDSSSNSQKSNGSVHIEADNGATRLNDGDAWSEVQEKALIQALKTFSKDTNQRWERVATAVPGKTVVQCKKKLASMKENFRSKKSAA